MDQSIGDAILYQNSIKKKKTIFWFSIQPIKGVFPLQCIARRGQGESASDMPADPQSTQQLLLHQQTLQERHARAEQGTLKPPSRPLHEHARERGICVTNSQNPFQPHSPFNLTQI
jgi:hypothetical protein